MTDILKPSGVEGFGDIPVDWEVNKMAFTFSFGKGLSITKEDLRDEGIPSITYGDIHSRFGFQINPEVDEVRCVEPRYLRTARNSLLQFGDFIFADTSEDIAGSGNFTHLNSHAPAFAGYHTITARAKRNIDVRFMAYLFDSEPFRNQIRNSVSGVKVFSVTQSIIKSAKVLLPPVVEQNAIAAFLDDRCGQIDGIIADLERQATLLQQYKKALITETVTKGLDKSAPMKDSGIDWIGEMPKHWNLLRIKNLAPVLRGASPRPIDDPVYFDDDGEVAWVRISDVTKSNGFLYETEQRLSPLGVRKSVELHPEELFVSICATVGKPCISKIRCCIHDGFVYFQNIDKSWNRYLFYIFEAGQCYEGLGKLGTQLNLNTQTIGDIKIPHPANGEQLIIADFLDAKCAETDSIIAGKQRSIETMRQYKRSLIYEYVTGKKRVAVGGTAE